jgi:hypothetical protein
VSTPPRCVLRSLATAPGVEVTGYGADDRLEVASDRGAELGRLDGAAIRIVAVIGGRRPYRVHWRDPHWMLSVANEWAVVRIGGELLTGPFPERALRDGDVIEIFAVDGRSIHRLGVELA